MSIKNKILEVLETRDPLKIKPFIEQIRLELLKESDVPAELGDTCYLSEYPSTEKSINMIDLIHDFLSGRWKCLSEFITPGSCPYINDIGISKARKILENTNFEENVKFYLYVKKARVSTLHSFSREVQAEYYYLRMEDSNPVTCHLVHPFMLDESDGVILLGTSVAELFLANNLLLRPQKTFSPGGNDKGKGEDLIKFE